MACSLLNPSLYRPLSGDTNLPSGIFRAGTAAVSPCSGLCCVSKVGTACSVKTGTGDGSPRDFGFLWTKTEGTAWEVSPLPCPGHAASMGSTQQPQERLLPPQPALSQIRPGTGTPEDGCTPGTFAGRAKECLHHGEPFTPRQHFQPM